MLQRRPASLSRFERHLSMMLVCLISLTAPTGVSALANCPRLDPALNVYPVYANATVAFEASTDSDNPLDLVLYRGVGSCSSTVIDRYSVEGSTPLVTAVFPYTVKGRSNLFVIVSWKINSRGVGTYGTLYQVYAYEKDGPDGLEANQQIAGTDQLTGMEGVADGEPTHFDGKTAAEVEKLIDRLHLK